MTLKYTYWQDGDMWLGFFKEYSDYITQGISLEELQDNLLDIYQKLISKRRSQAPHLHIKTACHI